jgi:hypothetical protein
MHSAPLVLKGEQQITSLDLEAILDTNYIPWMENSGGKQ